MVHSIKRSNIFIDGMELYQNKLQDLVQDFPFHISYERERAVDTGGVTRNFFPAFWESAYSRCFDGGSLSIPAVHPQIDMSLFIVLGTVMMHRFMSSGFRPVRVALPVVAGVFLGPSVNNPDQLLLDTFMDYLSIHDRSIFQEALEMAARCDPKFSSLVSKLVDVQSRFIWAKAAYLDNIQAAPLLLQTAPESWLNTMLEDFLCKRFK